MMLGISEKAFQGMGMLLNQNNTNRASTMRIRGTISEQTNEWIAACRSYAMKPTYIDVEVTLHNNPNNSCSNLSPEEVVSIIRTIQESKENSNE